MQAYEDKMAKEAFQRNWRIQLHSRIMSGESAHSIRRNMGTSLKTITNHRDKKIGSCEICCGKPF